MDRSRFTEYPPDVTLAEIIDDIRENTEAALAALRHERDTLKAVLATGPKGDKSDG